MSTARWWAAPASSPRTSAASSAAPSRLARGQGVRPARDPAAAADRRAGGGGDRGRRVSRRICLRARLSRPRATGSRPACSWNGALRASTRVRSASSSSVWRPDAYRTTDSRDRPDLVIGGIGFHGGPDEPAGSRSATASSPRSAGTGTPRRHFACSSSTPASCGAGTLDRRNRGRTTSPARAF